MDLVQAQIRSSPSLALWSPQPALCFTYERLHSTASQLADALARHADVRAGTCVATAIAHHPLQIVAQLGVMMSGACFCPLDPALPVERLLHILDAVRPRAILLPDSPSPSLLDAVARYAHASTITVTLAHDGALHADLTRDAPPAREPQPSAHPGLCYIVFTSGSTGR